MKQRFRINENQLKQIITETVKRVLKEDWWSSDQRTLGNEKKQLKYIPRYDHLGYDQFGYDRDGFDKRGYDKEGYDKEGFNRRGRDRQGYDKDGFNIYGYNRDNIKKDSQKWKNILKQKQIESDISKGLRINKPTKFSKSYLNKCFVPVEEYFDPEDFKNILGFITLVHDGESLPVNSSYYVLDLNNEIVGNLKTDVIYGTFDNSDALSSIFVQYVIFKHPDGSMTLVGQNGKSLNGIVKRYRQKYGGMTDYYFIPL